MAKIGAMLMNVHKGKMERPEEPPSKLQVSAHFGPDYGTMDGEHMHHMDVEEHGRMKKKVDGIQKALDNWIPEDVAAQAHKSLVEELKGHKEHLAELHARIQKHKAKKKHSDKETPAEDAGETSKDESMEDAE